MREPTASLLLTRIHRGAIQLIFQPHDAEKWRVPQVGLQDAGRALPQLLEWIACATPFTQLAHLAELRDPLAPDHTAYLFHVHDASITSAADPVPWFDIQDLPALAFPHEQKLVHERTRHITELIIAHQNPYRLIPGFR